jgi:hypothetical protein
LRLGAISALAKSMSSKTFGDLENLWKYDLRNKTLPVKKLEIL